MGQIELMQVVRLKRASEDLVIVRYAEDPIQKLHVAGLGKPAETD